MDEPIAFEKWMARAEATVSIYVGFDVAFAGATWTARGNSAVARPESPASVAMDYVPQMSTAGSAQTRRHPCTKDGARLAGEQVAEFLRCGKLAAE